MSAHTTTLELRLAPGGRAVSRMLGCCIGKGLEVVALSWRSTGPAAEASLELSGDPHLLARAELWLDRLVDVVEVRTQTETTPPKRGRLLREE